MQVAWIGLGHMGLPTAKAVAAAGHRVTAHDVRPPDPQEAAPLILKGSAREAAAGCDVVCIAVFSDDQVEDVLTGPEGLFPILGPGAVVAIFTTGTIASARKLAAAAPPGVAVLDTCFSRNDAMLKAGGELNLLVGGEAAALERCRPVLEPFARAIFHVGGSGAGRAIKLVNNLCWAAHNQIDAEAVRLAEGLGLDPYAAMRVILQCSGANDAQNVFVDESWRKRFETMGPYMRKDAQAAAEAARDAGVGLDVLQAAIEACTRPQAAERVAAREAEILGKPLRIEPLPPEEWTEEMRPSVAKVAGYENAKPTMHGVLVRSPGFAQACQSIMPYFLLHGSLPVRVRELAILRLAWVRQVPFIWGEHVRHGKAAGLTGEEIERVTAGSAAPGWSPHDRAVLAAAEELMDQAMISDATWEALAEFLEPGHLVELIGCVGQYQALGYLQNSLRIPLFEGNPGLSAR